MGGFYVYVYLRREVARKTCGLSFGRYVEAILALRKGEVVVVGGVGWKIYVVFVGMIRWSDNNN